MGRHRKGDHGHHNKGHGGPLHHRGHDGHHNKGHHGHGGKFAEQRKEFLKDHPEFPVLRKEFWEDQRKLIEDHKEFVKLNKMLKGEKDIVQFIEDHPKFPELRKKFLEGKETLKENNSKFLKLREELIVKKDIEKFTKDNPELAKEMQGFNKFVEKQLGKLEEEFMKDNQKFVKEMQGYSKLKEEFQKEFMRDNPKFAEKMKDLSKLKQEETAKLAKDFIEQHPGARKKIQEFKENVKEHTQEVNTSHKFWHKIGHWKKGHMDSSAKSDKISDKAGYKIDNPLKLLADLIDHPSDFHPYDPITKDVVVKGADSGFHKDTPLTLKGPH